MMFFERLRHKNLFGVLKINPSVIAHGRDLQECYSYFKDINYNIIYNGFERKETERNRNGIFNER